MSLKGKPFVALTTTTIKPEKVETFQPGTTYVQYTCVYADDKGTVLDITPGRTNWLADDAVILNQRQAEGLLAFASKSQAFLGFAAEDKTLSHIHDRAFQVKATDAVQEWIGNNCHIGGKTQVAFFQAKTEASRSTRKAYDRAFNKAYKALLAS
jgi:nitrogen-specific signal transduction histidine kinase